jgi:hypothetical protein
MKPSASSRISLRRLRVSCFSILAMMGVRPQAPHEFFARQNILPGAHGGQGDEIHPLGDAEAQVFPVFVGEG